MTSPSKRDRIAIALALDDLREAMTGAIAGPVGTPAVRLALRCLLPHYPERWPPTAF